MTEPRHQRTAIPAAHILLLWRDRSSYVPSDPVRYFVTAPLPSIRTWPIKQLRQNSLVLT